MVHAITWTFQSPQDAGAGLTYTVREVLAVPGIAVVIHLQSHNLPCLHEANLVKRRVSSIVPSLCLSLTISSHLSYLQKTERIRHHTMK